MNNLQMLLRDDLNILKASFQRASIAGEGTPQEVADRREAALHSFLRKYFPYPYRIAKGNISDSRGLRSSSIDALVINPSHPHTVECERYSFIMAEGVDYALELKPDLSRSSEFQRALQQISTVKKLRRARAGPLLQYRLSSERRATLLTVPSVVFTETLPHENVDIFNQIDRFCRDNTDTPNSQLFDGIISLDGRLVIRTGRRAYKSSDAEQVWVKQFGIDVLYYGLGFLIGMPPGTPLLSDSLISHYVHDPFSVEDGEWEYSPELDRVLQARQPVSGHDPDS